MQCKRSFPKRFAKISCFDGHFGEQAPVGDSDDTSFGDFIEDKAADNPMEEAGFSMLKDKIKDVLDTLTEREREVLEQRFGLKDGYSRTLEKVGRQFLVARRKNNCARPTQASRAQGH